MKWILLVAVALLVGCQTETTPEVTKPSEKELNFQYNTKTFFEEVEKCFDECGKPDLAQKFWEGKLDKMLKQIDPPAAFKSEIIKDEDLMQTLNTIRGRALGCVLLNVKDQDDIDEANELMTLIRQKYLD